MIIGGLALAGIPILNGFWSKELVLEAGHEGGPAWAWPFMLIGAGLTALYTFRFLSMVFYGEPRGHAHAHDAGPAMKVALVPLALGTLTTWLLAGPFGAVPRPGARRGPRGRVDRRSCCSTIVDGAGDVSWRWRSWRSAWRPGGSRESLVGRRPRAPRHRHDGVEQLRLRGDQPRRRPGDGRVGRVAPRRRTTAC